jgi:signal transduction histidine kinase
MQGNIIVKSDLGLGAEFIVTIPMEISMELTNLVE